MPSDKSAKALLTANKTNLPRAKQTLEDLIQ